jgi:hypothetical protein
MPYLEISKKSMKKKLSIFALSFIGALLVFVTILHTFETRGGGPLSWTEIFDDWLLFVISSAIMATVATILWGSNHPPKD